MAPKRERNSMAMVADYAGLALVLPLSVAIGYGIGFAMDKYFHTHFWYLIWMLAGVAAGFRSIFVKLSTDAENQDRK